MKKIVVPGDDPAGLMVIYAFLAFVLTSILSKIIYYRRFVTYTTGAAYVNGVYETMTKMTIEGCERGSETLAVAFDNVFIGTSIFFLICILMIARNYYSFHKDSKSCYLMKRISNPMELHVRCLTLPLIAMAADAAFTAILLLKYYDYYLENIGINCYYDLWEVLL